MRPSRRAVVASAAVLAIAVSACRADQVSDDAADAGEMESSSSDSGGSGSGTDNAQRETAPPEFEDHGQNPTVDTAEDNQSTFALDVDTGSYAITRSFINQQMLPPPEAVRTEELVNYFPQDYEAPESGLGIHVDGTAVPFLSDPSKRVVRVGIQGQTVDNANRPPATLTFVVDTSGSMADGKLDMVKQSLNLLVGSLEADDEVAIVRYSDDASVHLEATPASESETIANAIEELQTEGSTNAEAGLISGYEQAGAHLRDEGINRVILLSDGVANVGQVDPAALAADVAQAAGDQIQLVTVGVGLDTYNDPLMEQLADQGNGFYAFVDTQHEAERLFVEDLTGTLQTVALNAKVRVSFDPSVVTDYRLLGYENRQVDDDALQDDAVDGGEVGAGHTTTALYEVTLDEGATGSAETSLATVDLHWNDPASGAGVDRSATLTMDDLAASFDEASPRLRQDVLVAAWAEALRNGPWAESLGLEAVAANAGQLSGLFPDEARTTEFVELTEAARDLA